MSANILLVDDNELNLNVLSRWLTQDGHIAQKAKNVTEAHRLLRCQRFDLAILDLELQHTDGFTVLQEFKSNPDTRDMPVVMVSPTGSDDVARKCRIKGAIDVIVRPFIKSTFTKQIENCLHQWPEPGVKIIVDQHDDSATTVLIVDDDSTNMDLLKRAVTKLGVNIITAENGHKAMAVINNSSIDLVLLDIRMPDIDGIEVLRWIRQEYSPGQLPVFMVSAEHSTQTKLECIEEGANDYFAKPYDTAVLRQHIEDSIRDKNLAIDMEMDILANSVAP